MSAATTLTEPALTGEAFAVLGDAGSYELVEGKIITVSPPGFEHGEIELAVGVEIRAFVHQHNLGRVAVGEVGVYTRRNPDTVRGVDVLFISHERYAQKTTGAFLDVAPDLVVEVLSPGNTWTEMMQKLREFFAIGVRLVWLVDPVARNVLAYRAITDVREFSFDDELPGDDVLPGFALPVAHFFEN